VKSLDLLGYQVSCGELQPDPSRLQSLMTLQPPCSPKELKRITGLLAYYAKWIKDFSKKARPLQSTSKFPLGNEALEAFKTLKSDLIHASLGVIRDDLPDDLLFEVETDASDYAIAAILSQGGRPCDAGTFQLKVYQCYPIFHLKDLIETFILLWFWNETEHRATYLAIC